ncbi:MAG TPA: ABC transporter ATP-binding protein [Acetivibrio sp.]|nr:ABC transporter ATP-binding protein [Acetivibrio sp.]
MTAILEIKNLRKEYKDFSLKDINLTLEKGFIMGFIGPNGAGKSTTIKLILNLVNKDGGEINIFGKDNIAFEKEVKNRIGFVLDEGYYYEEITVREMKSIIAHFYDRWDEGAFKKYAKDFGLPIEKKIRELSKGMKMKFSLAIALSHDAELLIMDEPTSGLDPVVRSELLDILSDLMQDENKGVFFSTHITSDLDKIADYITFINNGEIIFSTTKDDIMDNFGVVKGPKELIRNNGSNGFIGIRENQYGFEALVQNKEEFRKLYGDIAVIEKPTLEDIMVYYTRRGIYA